MVIEMFSKLIKGVYPHHNKFSSRKKAKVTRTFVHHWAGLGSGGMARLVDPKAKASANYIIRSNGDIYGQVPEEYRAWTSGTKNGVANDINAITVEIENYTTRAQGKKDADQESWTITNEARDAWINLMVDVAIRYGFQQFNSTVFLGHFQVAATACPGGYIRHNLPSWIGIIDGRVKGHNRPSVKPNPPKTSKSINDLAQEVIDGKHGNGDARKKSLGASYSQVQAEVNKILSKSRPATQKSIQQLAQEVIDGKHGNGDARKKSLGSRYAAVQAEVNKILG